MIRFLVLSSFLFIFSHAALATCKTSNSVIGAEYKITTLKKNDNRSHSRHLVLWRNGRQVAHQLSETGITEVWEQTSNGLLRLVRYFDHHHRGIEYQPNEINKGKGNKNWEIKTQLITNKLIKAMQKKSVTGKDCKKTAQYALKSGNKTINLDWLTQPRLVKSYSETTEASKTQWELLRIITDKKQINSIFSVRSNYQTTDYADIGDNESDPFLMKMINLGFVEHGASGFYDTKGNTLKAHHHH